MDNQQPRLFKMGKVQRLVHCTYINSSKINGKSRNYYKHLKVLYGNIKIIIKIQSNLIGNYKVYISKNLLLTFKYVHTMKMLEDKVNPIGMFTTVLFTTHKTSLQGVTSYYFITNKHVDERGILIPAKSPIGMFDDKLIPNDMGLVLQKMNEYNNS